MKTRSGASAEVKERIVRGSAALLFVVGSILAQGVCMELTSSAFQEGQGKLGTFWTCPGLMDTRKGKLK